MEHSDKHGVVLSQSSGYTIDNLDTKTCDEAVGVFERIFVEIREVLSEDQTPVAAANLQICHQIARRLSQRFKIED
jgi:hypothetical protein